MTKVSALTDIATTSSPADTIYIVQGGLSKKGSPEILLDIAKVSGVWDMSVTATADVEPDAAVVTQASSTKTDDDNYEMTPVSGATTSAFIGSVSGVAVDATLQTARVKAPNTGGNLLLVGFALTNAEATQAEIATAFGTGGALNGALTHLALALAPVATFGPFTSGDIGFTAADTAVPAGGVDFASGAGFAFTPGTDDLYFSVDGTDPAACALSLRNSPDAGVTITDTVTSTLTLKADDYATTLRLHVFLYFASGTIVFPDGTLNFDFSATAAGAPSTVPFAVENATLPVDARDGRRYEVSVGGPFAGKTTVAGDIVELKNTETDIFITRFVSPSAINAQVAAYLAANPVLSLLNDARMLATMLTVADDEPTGTFLPWVRGHAVMVGTTPAGAFSAMAAGNVAVWDDAAWVEYNPEDFEGVEFATVDPDFGLRRVAYTFNTPAAQSGTVCGFPIVDLDDYGWSFPFIYTSGTIDGGTVAGTDAGSDMLLDGPNVYGYAMNDNNGVYTLNLPTGICITTLSSGVADAVTCNVVHLPYPIVLKPRGGFSYCWIISKDQRPISVVYDRESIFNAWTKASSVYTTIFDGVWADVGAPYQAVMYRKRDDMVDLRGKAYNPSGGAVPLIMVLPSHCRPSATVELPVTLRDGSGVPELAVCEVDSSGNVTLEYPATIISTHTVSFNTSFSISAQAES